MIWNFAKSGERRNFHFCQGKKGQMKIQQMAFMLVAVFLFFALVGLFFFGWQYSELKKSYAESQKEQAITSLKVIAGMAELNCDDSRELCLDEDKIQALSESKTYDKIWPVASIKVIKVYPAPEKTIKCPAPNCSYYNVYDSGQKNVEGFSTFVNICKKIKDEAGRYEKCEIGKLILGQKIK